MQAANVLIRRAALGRFAANRRLITPLLQGLQKPAPASQTIIQNREGSVWERRKRKILPRVPTFDYSGDDTLDDPVTIDEGDNIFTSLGLDSNDLDEANRDLYSIETADGRRKLELIMDKTVKQFGRHENDHTSLEVTIAKQTVYIRRRIKHMQRCPKDMMAKRQLVELIQARKSKLTEMHRLNRDKFDWLCEELKITFTPTFTYKDYNQGKPRRHQVRTAAIHEMMSAKEKKLADLKTKLDKEREEYYSRKEEVMNAIKEEQRLIEEETTALSQLRIVTGYAGDMGEQAVKLADIKPVKREKWWRKHPDVLRMKYGNRAKIPDPNVIRTR